ncbi:hypothetical protein GCM10010218_04610 [Streptomyces mashuensis]|uniref:DUF397 domain-containing protein n=1 Tax=Streptomyces mashuensis TaxID=33904 RepID=A0A919E952_9ACTN|nr:DUF397 domain-containing protein [Streptomyces mashuensis]GHF26767.1 hypothetical protein GCM10010218_04610 [Streptomyces mashuensis]
MSTTAWRKSTHSAAAGDGCLEVAADFRTTVPIRDSKNPTGPILSVPAPAWASFVNAISHGDLPTGSTRS